MICCCCCCCCCALPDDEEKEEDEDEDADTDDDDAESGEEYERPETENGDKMWTGDVARSLHDRRQSRHAKVKSSPLTARRGGGADGKYPKTNERRFLCSTCATVRVKKL